MKKYLDVLGYAIVFCCVFLFVWVCISGATTEEEELAQIIIIVDELDGSSQPVENLGFKGLEDDSESTGADEMGFGSPFSFSGAVTKVVGAIETFFGMGVDDKKEAIMNDETTGFSAIYTVAQDAVANNFFQSILSGSGVDASGGSGTIAVGGDLGFDLNFVGAEDALSMCGYFFVGFCGFLGLLDFLKG